MSSVEFQIVSDLHLETPSARPTYSDFRIEPRCPHLALLGDIGLTSDSRLFEFIEKQLKQFETVFYVLGNHEPYDTAYTAAKEALRSFGEKMKQRQVREAIGRFIFLDQTRYDITPEVTVLGCTLFSAISPVQRQSIQFFVTDYERIMNWTPDAHNVIHASDLAWLNSQVSHISQTEPHRSIVVFTHHSPTIMKEANNPRHLEDASEVRSAFMTDLSREPCWISPAVRLWAFGHTHFNCDFDDIQSGTRVYTNQKGYARSEAEGFDAEKTVTIRAQ